MKLDFTLTLCESFYRAIEVTFYNYYGDHNLKFLKFLNETTQVSSI